MSRKLTERQKICRHNQEVKNWQLRVQGFTGTVYKKIGGKYVHVIPINGEWRPAKNYYL